MIDLDRVYLPDQLNPREFGRFLKKLRKETFKMDQHSFGYMLCLNRSLISRMEHGKRKPSDMFLSDLLEIIFKLEYPDYWVINRELD